MIKVESKYHAISENEVVEHRRLLTPWFFIRLKPNRYNKINTTCFFLTVPLVFRGWEKNGDHLVFECDEAELVEKLNYAVGTVMEPK